MSEYKMNLWFGFLKPDDTRMISHMIRVTNIIIEEHGKPAEYAYQVPVLGDLEFRSIGNQEAWQMVWSVVTAWVEETFRYTPQESFVTIAGHYETDFVKEEVRKWW